MKKNVVIAISVISIVLVVGIVLCVFLFVNKSNYDKIVEAGNQNYEVNLVFSNYRAETELNYFGEYDVNENKLNWLDDNEESLHSSGNLYSYFANYLDKQHYEEKEYNKVMLLQDLYETDPFFANLTTHHSSTYICIYDFYKNKILKVDCVNDHSNLVVDFLF